MPARLIMPALVVVCLALAACAGPQPSRREQPPRSTDALLIIRDTPNGGIEAFWLPESESGEFLNPIEGSLDSLEWEERHAPGLEHRLVLASTGRMRDCDKEQIDCFNRCWKRKPPYPREKGGPGHHEYCRLKCMREYRECLARNNQPALDFTALDEAVDWLGRHRKEVLVGTVLVAAGVTFVVVSAGAGALVLAPLIVI